MKIDEFSIWQKLIFKVPASKVWQVFYWKFSSLPRKNNPDSNKKIHPTSDTQIPSRQTVPFANQSILFVFQSKPTK